MHEREEARGQKQEEKSGKQNIKRKRIKDRSEEDSKKIAKTNFIVKRRTENSDVKREKGARECKKKREKIKNRRKNEAGDRET